MLENFNANNDITVNSFGNVEVNSYTKKAMINCLTPGLSYYEMICKPRVIIDESKLKFGMDRIHKIIKEILRCNICLQIYNEPYNIKNCLHKFCKKCIEDYNRRVKKECAICRQPIEHRRVMREDAKFKNIIKCIISNLDKYNEVENKIFDMYLPKMCHNKIPNNNHNENFKFSFENSLITQQENNTTTNENFLERKTNRKENYDEALHRNTKNEVMVNESHKKPKEKIYLKLIREMGEENTTSKMHLYIEDENITLESLAKYICKKNNYPEEVYSDKIWFSISDSQKNKLNIPKNYSIEKLRKDYPYESTKTIIFFNIKN